MVHVFMVFENIWQNVGLELVIFAVTLVVALIMRTIPKKQIISVPKQCKQDMNLSDKPAAVSRQCTSNQPVAQRSNAQKEQSPFGSSHREVAHTIDEVIDTMKISPGMKSANKVLAAYAELVPQFREIQIMEVTRCSKHSAIDFYTLVLHCAIRVGKYHLIDGIIDGMTYQGVERPVSFYESAMKQLAGQKHHHFALAMYDRLVGDGLEPSAVTCSCLISFAAEVGEYNRAIAFFEKLASMTTPSIRAYMTVLRVHAKRQDWLSSLATLRDMQGRQVAIDSLVLNVILATGVAADQLEDVEELIAEVDSLGTPVSDIVSYNTLLKGYAQRNDACKAISVIRQVRERRLMPNAISFNTAMDASVRSSRSADAWMLLEEMREARLRPDKFTCSILVKGLSRGPTSGHIRKCLELLREVDPSCDEALRSTLYHAVLDASAHVADSAVLMQAFTQMRCRHVVPSASAYRHLVQALGQEGDAARCSEVWQQMLSEDARPQAAIFVALMESHLKQGQVDAALGVFNSLRAGLGSRARQSHDRGGLLLQECLAALLRGLCRISREPEATRVYLQAKTDGSLAKVDSATGIALARLQAETGNLPQSWITIEDMMALGHQPSEALLHAFLSACIRQSHTLYAKTLLQRAASFGLILSQATYVLFFKLYGRTQQLQDALAVFADMTNRQGVKPAPQTAAFLLQVCFQCNRPDCAEEVLDKLQAASASPLDIAIYRALASGYVTVGLESKAVSVAEEASRYGTALPQDALETIAAAIARRGQSGSADSARLQQLASSQGLSLGWYRS